jgi:hypothetical protein
MRKIFKLAFFCVFTSTIQAEQELKVSGYFHIDNEILDCRIENKNPINIVVEGMKDELLDAKFYDANNSEILLNRKYIFDIKSFQEWTRLLASSPDGVGNPGSIYRSILMYPNLPKACERSIIKYLEFECNIYTLSDKMQLVAKGRKKIRLMIR